MSPVITAVEAIPVRLPRDLASATGSAGSPSQLKPGEFAYRWSSTVPALYSIYLETCLVKITLSDGKVGWGEAQAPLAPRAAAVIVEDLLRPVLTGKPIDTTRASVEALYDEMYGAMRVRGHNGGFMVDAIAGADIALWDLAGQLAGLPVAQLIAGPTAKVTVPAYLSGLTGATIEEKLAFAAPYFDQGIRLVKLFHDKDPQSLFDTMDAITKRFGSELRVAVDALWRLELPDAIDFGHELDHRAAHWFEAPLMPEDPAAHADLAAAVQTPLALGESYRTVYEMEPFFERNIPRFLQPDLGRTGITGALRLTARAAELGTEVVPHVSIAMAPQIAAAIHFAAAVPSARLCEFNPAVAHVANRFSLHPIVVNAGKYNVSAVPGLGAAVLEEQLHSNLVA